MFKSLKSMFGGEKEKEAQQEKVNEGLNRTRSSFFGQISEMFVGEDLNDDFWDDLEAMLIQADVGVETSTALVAATRKRAELMRLNRSDKAKELFKHEMLKLVAPAGDELEQPRKLTVVLVVGVNGSGKTTTIAKMANLYKSQGKSVVIAAGDTFRAAAIDQIKIWGERIDVPVIANQPNSDPGAVVFDALKSSLARKADVLIIDTAGRLHTKFNLMKELEKIHSIAGKQVHEAPHEVLLVLDGTTGQNAIAQAKHFKNSVDITGVVITKLDGTPKGGSILAIGKELAVPVRFIGVGEKVDDLLPFDHDVFIDGLLSDFGKSQDDGDEG